MIYYTGKNKKRINDLVKKNWIFAAIFLSFVILIDFEGHSITEYKLFIQNSSISSISQ